MEFFREKKIDKIIELYRDATGSLPFERGNEELASLVSGQPHQVRVSCLLAFPYQLLLSI